MTILDSLEAKNIRYKYNSISTYNGKSYMVYYYRWDQWKKAMDEVSKHSTIRRRLTRAFTDGIYIYALSREYWYSRIAHKRLLLHEIGHILGYGHTKMPTLMNPTWLFRWSDTPLDGWEEFK